MFPRLAHRVTTSGGYRKKQELPGTPVTLSFGQETLIISMQDNHTVRADRGEDIATYRHTQSGREGGKTLPCQGLGCGGVGLPLSLFSYRSVPLRREPRPQLAEGGPKDYPWLLLLPFPDYTRKDDRFIFLKHRRPCPTVLYDSLVPRRESRSPPGITGSHLTFPSFGPSNPRYKNAPDLPRQERQYSNVGPSQTNQSIKAYS